MAEHHIHNVAVVGSIPTPGTLRLVLPSELAQCKLPHFMQNQPIGILDSGVGGLSIWKEIVGLLPDESTGNKKVLKRIAQDLVGSTNSVTIHSVTL